MVPFLTPSPLSLDWRLAPQPKTSIAIISGTRKDFKFGRYIHKVYPNKSSLKILEERERGRIQGLHNFLSTPIIPGTGKSTNFKFCMYIHRISRNKSPLKISGKVAVDVGLLMDSRKFSGHLYSVLYKFSSCMCTA